MQGKGNGTWGPIGRDPSGGARCQGRRTRDSLQEVRPREGEIMALVVEGKTDKEIGNALGIAEETVGWYLKRLYAAYALHNRAQLTHLYLTQFAQQAALGAPPPHTSPTPNGPH
jgi:DNA-binding CsgD family transcriptional regulator